MLKRANVVTLQSKGTKLVTKIFGGRLK